MIVTAKVPVAPVVKYCGTKVLVVAPNTLTTIAEMSAVDVMSRSTSVPPLTVVVNTVTFALATTYLGVITLEHVTTVSKLPLAIFPPTVTAIC